MSSNWIDSFVEKVSKLTDTPLLFIEASAYFIAGSAIRKQVFFRNNTNIYPNLYYLLVAPPFRFHKTTVLEIGQNILHADCGNGLPLVSDFHFLPQDGSDVAFDDAMVESGGYGIAYYEEFSKFVGSAKREHTSGIQCKFLEYFNPSMVDKKSKTRKDGDRVIPKGSVVNFASACTDEDFEMFMTSSAVTSGQMSRLLIFKPTEQDARPTFDPQPETPPSFYPEMAKELKGRIPKVQSQMPFSRGAKESLKGIKDELDAWFQREPNGVVIRGATSRYLVILQRLSMIRAVMRGSGIVEAEDVDSPIEKLMNPYLSSIKRLNRFGYLERPDQVLRARIYKRIENGRVTPVHVLARDLNESVLNIQLQIKILMDQGHVYSIKFDGIMFYTAYGEDDVDRNTTVTKAERTMNVLRARLHEENVKVTKAQMNGAVIYSGEREVAE